MTIFYFYASVRDIDSRLRGNDNLQSVTIVLKQVKFMKRKIFKSKSNSNIQALNKNQHYESQQDPPSKKSVSFNPLVTTINYVKETYEEETYEEETDEEIVAVPVVPVVQAKPIKWYTKVHDFFYTLTQTNHNDGYSSVNHGYSANHDEVDYYPNTVNLDVSDTVNLTGAEVL
ncbi:hypothetical protein [Candidatus Tisiphia endosymbiont of Ptychoptera albimana]|uniref:hypothetical protein n=1 Tax=Candidatus Tisiphia endosymbiont of Ptychoptera albimana TaxID=3066260 RepID=UPI00312C7701